MTFWFLCMCVLIGRLCVVRSGGGTLVCEAEGETVGCAAWGEVGVCSLSPRSRSGIYDLRMLRPRVRGLESLCEALGTGACGMGFVCLPKVWPSWPDHGWSAWTREVRA